jgi:hypothetical protein
MGNVTVDGVRESGCHNRPITEFNIFNCIKIYYYHVS